jgi:hypothetical protein
MVAGRADEGLNVRQRGGALQTALASGIDLRREADRDVTMQRHQRVAQGLRRTSRVWMPPRRDRLDFCVKQEEVLPSDRAEEAPLSAGCDWDLPDQAYDLLDYLLEIANDDKAEVLRRPVEADRISEGQPGLSGVAETAALDADRWSSVAGLGDVEEGPSWRGGSAAPQEILEEEAVVLASGHGAPRYRPQLSRACRCWDCRRSWP